MTDMDIDVFNSKTLLPDPVLTEKAKSLLGFDARYRRISDQLQLLFRIDDLDAWNKKYHKGALSLVALVKEQCPLVVFYGDIGTGKSTMAECLANRLVEESKVSDSMLFKLSNRVRGDGKVGLMGTLLSEALRQVEKSAGKSRRAILIIDEADSLAAARSSGQNHHEDKVAVNTLIQGIDEYRKYNGRVLAILCTNRASVLDPAIQRRAAVVEEFRRPNNDERLQLLKMDLGVLGFNNDQCQHLVAATGASEDSPDWTYSDIRTRLYLAALATAFPDRPLTFEDLLATTKRLKPSPVVEGQ